MHQGYAPDVVAKSWGEKIGFYFDDATHGDPGWTDNYSFFRRFFTSDAIVCGDDFAGGWPDIVKNVYRISTELDVPLFVIGRVWAFSLKRDTRIEDAIDHIYPKLRGVSTTTVHNGITQHTKSTS